VARRCDMNLGPLVTDLELCTMVKTGKKPVSSESCKARVRITPGYEDSYVGAVVIVPFDGEAMCGVLGGQSDRSRQVSRPEVSQADQAYPADGPTRNDEWPKRSGDVTLSNFRVDPVVDK
jgi:hypothetical protein